MPKITLISSAVAYSLFTLLHAADKQTPYSVRGLNVQFPDATVEAANTAGPVKVGGPDSWTAPTAITQPDVALQPGDAYLYPASRVNDISLTEKYVNAPVNNAVLYVNYETA